MPTIYNPQAEREGANSLRVITTVSPDELPLAGETKEAAEARLAAEADALSERQAEERKLIDARDAKARKDVDQVAKAIAEDDHRRNVADWSRKLEGSVGGASVAPDTEAELLKRLADIGCPVEALRASDNSRDREKVEKAMFLWSKMTETNKAVAERELEAARQAALRREADRLLEWENRHASDGFVDRFTGEAF